MSAADCLAGDPCTAPDFAAAALITIDTQRDVLDGGPFEIPGTSAALGAMRVPRRHRTGGATATREYCWTDLSRRAEGSDAASCTWTQESARSALTRTGSTTITAWRSTHTTSPAGSPLLLGHDQRPMGCRRRLCRRAPAPAGCGTRRCACRQRRRRSSPGLITPAQGKLLELLARARGARPE